MFITLFIIRCIMWIFWKRHSLLINISNFYAKPIPLKRNSPHNNTPSLSLHYPNRIFEKCASILHFHFSRGTFRCSEYGGTSDICFFHPIFVRLRSFFLIFAYSSVGRTRMMEKFLSHLISYVVESLHYVLGTSITVHIFSISFWRRKKTI